jgi:peptidoglycan hydrolase-like protein with peptidoglycan-binding domain
MGVVTARIVFLAFLGLTGTIIYNALYLQEHAPRGMAMAPAPGTATTAQIVHVEPRPDLPVEQAASVQPKSVAPVSTDLAPLDTGKGESQLVVRAVQRELSARGYDVGQVDGNLSDKTRSAISAFQSKEGLPVTGLPSDDLLRHILLGDSVAPAAATGSVTAPDSIAANAAESGKVKEVQQTLADLGYAPGPIDGAWGANTASAISAFQRDRSLAETGQITPELLSELERVTGHDRTRTASHP